ncbi:MULTISPECIES: ATP-dependent helicase HrpB [Citromicrobium]|uniref:ATP-dependent helicase HrpB n=1 Tax=Citromicrobium TaxID=72173 RepID=UPI00030150B7|nr:MULTISPECIES: ATP-dependent helicase HrpB [Citromicrobium]ALG61593.1 ATP-dependent helicase [Citromicrobium sp. JL477]KPM13957.1 ATP-dependent helicase [Citromicrobium sp. JL1351]KPM21009.1 ATP-dependent helicase [Citromicrobium sp. JL31]KPM26994.1 ATP-dependent helicase [Citromicrobium sp. JL2201]
MPDDSSLPIHAVLAQLKAALRDGPNAVLVAPPGAGKTTAVAPALLGEDWCTGEVLLLSPRRVAARAAAERMAAMLGEKPGETIGYLTRLDSKRSAKTRVTVLTEAIFLNRIVADPELPGVSAVLFDEAHERHLDSDFGLALALETQGVLREDLRLVVMSATLDGERFAGLMNDCPVIESEGRSHPLRIEWLGASGTQRFEDAMADAVAQAWRAEEGDILAFLPGVREIERVRERLEDRLRGAVILPLHGQVDPAGQRAAIRRDAEGRRRIVLATAIAETSLTLEGVTVVVDGGLSRRAEYDRAAGGNRLVTVQASQASATQRAGRAARQVPGVAYRLWAEAAHAGRPAFEPPEIATSDLAPLVLTLAQWGESEPANLRWLDPPPEASLATAREELRALGALDGEGRITPQGETMAQLPLDPAGAAMVLFGERHGCTERAARLVLLLQERGLGGRGEDLEARLSRWNGERGGRADASRKLAGRWAAAAQNLTSVRPEPVERRGRERASTSSARTVLEVPLAIILAAGRPGFIAKRRDNSGEDWLTANGRGYRLDPTSSVARAEYCVIGDAQGSAQGARITAAAALEEADLRQWLGERIALHRTLRWTGERVEARREERLGALVLSKGQDPVPDMDAVQALLVDKALDKLGELLPAALLARARFAGIEGLSSEILRETAELWLAPLLAGRRDLAVSKGKLVDAVLGQLDWNERQRLDQAAPREFVSPAGTHHPIDYEGQDAPAVEVRVQALYGLDRHPMIGQGKSASPLLLKLTSPAGRPVQATRDLPAFWRGSWADVRKDMKGRYPKHRWPDEPWTEVASLKTKNAFSRGQG